ncbi:hypothetical protein I8751_09885 [Nostocaceae cyanobacterium CENA357]|uniref:Uncharacterized protein n=1 Tax=Atlanticothrix silvestris CENA357 TaxID=1725252 RepID=A0A8J7L3K8_9CYAN|nr:hypothetical protein [Atlanticothrix silvestris]MBH8552677.1 hypothetical protein [Atlanticothrix silvestris CENA357]
MEVFGHLYIPLKYQHEGKLKTTIFRDEFCFVDGKLFTAHYAGLKVPSPAVASLKSIRKLSDNNIEKALEILKFPSALAQLNSDVWKQFDRQFRERKKIYNYWPTSFSSIQEDFDKPFENYSQTSDSELVDTKRFTQRIALRTSENHEQNQRIVREAKEFLRIFRVAFSEDLFRLEEYLNLVKENKRFRLEINLASPVSLKQACERELFQLRDLEENHNGDGGHILSNLDSLYDAQAKEKYLDDASANFARALVDSMCAIKAMQVFFRRREHEELQSQLAFNLFEKAPTFRGNITDREIAYVTTPCWQPGMLGNLHVHRLQANNKSYWHKVKRRLEEEIRTMNSVEIDLSEALFKLEKEAIEAIKIADRRSSATKQDVDNLKRNIQAIATANSSSDESIKDTFERIKELRSQARKQFEQLFPRFDEELSKILIFSSNPKEIEKISKEKPVDSLSQIFDKLEEVIVAIQAMPNQPKYNFPNAQNVKIIEQAKTYIEQVGTYIEDSKATDPDLKLALDDLKQVIVDLQQKHPQATEEQATAVIEAEFEEIKRVQPHRWQKLLSLKRLWHGLKQGSFKVSEHFAEETPWGKGVIGFLEGVMDEVE